MINKTNEITNKTKKERGVTLIALVVTIMVLTIIAGISINAGKGTIKKAKLEEYRTNMLLIKSKAKEYYEEAEFKIGPYSLTGITEPEKTKRKEVTKEVMHKSHKLIEVESENCPSYTNIQGEDMLFEIQDEAFEQMGLNFKRKSGEKYYIKINVFSKTIEVYNSIGFDGKHSLTEIENYDIKLQSKEK